MIRAKGFTFSDLVIILVLVFILAGLACVIVPGISHAIRLANQDKCRANLHGIGKAIAMYKSEGNSSFPLLWTTGQPEANIARSDPAGTIEELRTKLAGRETALQNVWLLIDKEFVGEEAFACPLDSDYEARELTTAQIDAGTHAVGWQSSANFSYGLHFPYESTMVEGRAIENPAHLGPQLKDSFVIMADKNPSQNNEPATGVGSDKSPSNHEEDGEMHLMYSGAVGWKPGAQDSNVNGDDIYTTETQDNSNPATPANLDDQYIVRHPALPKKQ